MSRSIGFRKISVDVPIAGKAVAISNTRILTPFIEIFFPSTNGGNMFVGDSTVSSTWTPRAANSTHRFSSSERGDVTSGDYFDLSKIYLNAATAGDDAIVQYFASEE